MRLACLFGSLRSSVSAQKVLCRNRSTCWWTSDVFVAGSGGGGSLPILLLHHLESLLWDIMTQTWAFESWSPCCLVQHATICCFDRQRRPVWETASYPCSFPWRCGIALEVVCERRLEEFASPTAFEFPVLFISDLGFMTSFFFLTEVYLTYNVILISGVQQSDSVIHTCMCLCFVFFFQILLPFRLL